MIEEVLEKYTLEEILELNDVTIEELLEELVSQGIIVLPVV